jgi:hypothetical protein
VAGQHGRLLLLHCTALHCIAYGLGFAFHAALTSREWQHGSHVLLLLAQELRLRAV